MKSFEEEIKEEVKNTLTQIVNKFSGNTKQIVLNIVNNVNITLASMITDPEKSEQYTKDLKILYTALAIETAISEREISDMIRESILRVTMRGTSLLIAAI